MKTKTITVSLVGYQIDGVATVHPWGGGRGTIQMKSHFLKPEHFSKDNVLRCVNDGGFGVESIESAEISVTEVYDNGGTGKGIEFVADSDYSRELFLGWNHLREIGAIK